MLICAIPVGASSIPRSARTSRSSSLRMPPFCPTAGSTWYTAGAPLKSGHPHHPLYLKRDTALLPMDIDAYIEKA